MTSAAARLRQRLEDERIVLVPGVTNALYARIAQRAGMEAAFVTGAGVANTSFGVPDLGMVTMTEVVENTRRIADAVDLPIIADADTGYGGHLNAMRAVRLLEDAGVAGLIIEDQREPKRCGHFSGKQLVGTDEMVEKLVAARRARRDEQLLLFARTDAIAVEGLERALERARTYARAGADVIFVEAPRTTDEMAAIPQAVDVPCLVNLVEGGVTPVLELDRLQEMGFRLALYANLALRVAAASVAAAFATLRRDGTSDGLLDRMLSWEQRQELVGLETWSALDRDIAAEARAILDAAGQPATGAPGISSP